jgi:hypothetical protein
MKLNKWLKGLLSAVIGGAAASVATYLNTGQLNGKQLGGAALVGALTTGAAYLMKSPLDKVEDLGENKLP